MACAQDFARQLPRIIEARNFGLSYSLSAGSSLASAMQTGANFRPVVLVVEHVVWQDLPALDGNRVCQAIFRISITLFASSSESTAA